MKKEAREKTLVQRTLFGIKDRKESEKPSLENHGHLHPRLHKHLHSTKSKTDAEESSLVSRKNTSCFYETVYNVLISKGAYDTGHKRTLEFSGEEPRRFEPDLYQEDMLGTHFVEIKAASTRKSNFPCRLEQLENYIYLYLENINAEQIAPTWNTALIRYGNRENQHLFKKSNNGLGKYLSRKTRDMLILTPNLLFLLCTLSKRSMLKNADGYERNYFEINSSAINLLHQLDSPYPNIRQFLKEYTEILKKPFIKPTGVINMSEKASTERRIKCAYELASKKWMHLRDGELTLEKKISSAISPLEFKGHSLAPFPISIYSLRDYDIWLRDFNNHHPEMSKILRVDNLYSSIKEPF